MVIESLLNAAAVLRKPWLMLLYGFGVANVGIVLASWVFKDHAALVLVFLTALALVPLFIQAMMDQEMLGLTLPSETAALKQHGLAVLGFILCFVGMSVAFGMWYVFKPAFFGVQTQTIAALSNSVTARAVTPGLFTVILINNLKVLLFCVFFAFIYGAGGIFILTWNASVIGAAIGSFVERGATAAGGAFLAYAAAGGWSMVRYFTHGIPEVAAYWIGALAGGMLSAAFIRRHFSKEAMDKVMLDASDMIIAAIVVLVIASAIETFVTPMLVS